MSRVITRVNLSAQVFPFISSFSGQAVFVKGTDQNYIAQVTSSADLDKDVGIASVYYCHNVIATGQGYQAVDYQEVSVATTAADFVGIVQIFDAAEGKKAYLGYTASGGFWVALDPDYAWHKIAQIDAAVGKQVTVAYVSGVTYIYIANVGCYSYLFSLPYGSLGLQTLTGVTASEVLGITSVLGYLIAWTSNQVVWSSTVDPTDFTPSLSTGAGGGSVEGARGNIVACVGHTTGMMIYTDSNAVAAAGSGNSRYPFNFRELVASGGLADLTKVTWDAGSGNHYAYTTSGVQIITLTQTQTVFPELTDFLAGAVFEDFNESTRQLTRSELSSPMKKRLALVSDRYLVFSYGVTSFTHAVIYDIALKRWSKLKVPHAQAFEWNLLKAETVETPRRSLAFLQANGRVVVVKLDVDNANANGVVLLGKYQLVRNRMAMLQEVEIENVPDTGVVTVYDKYCVQGKTTSEAPGYPAYTSGGARKYLFSSVGVNHSLLIQGAFNLVNVNITMSLHGRL